jgi:glutamate N-acetyltransferase/amino-acid N-acetyltransferase
VSVTAPAGWLASAVHAGTKPSGKLDLALVFSDRPAAVAGAFTTSRIPSAHVTLCRPRVASGRARGFCVTAGIANAFTGEAGVADAEAMAAAAAAAAGVPVEEMLVAATGTIGHRLPMDLVREGITRAAAALSPAGGADAALAITTTDAYPKTSVRTVEVGGTTITVGGMAKGAGMIAPRMVPVATLLVFITTDAAASPELLRGIVARGLPLSFNAITVDGCMSTSDTALLFANGAAGVDADGSSAFEDAVVEVMRELAYAVVADGEGASRVIRVRVRGAASDEDAYAAAREIASSVLLRCAIYGGDPNYGRVAQALGQAGADVDPGRLTISIAGVELSRGGVDTGRTEEAAKALAAGGDVAIEVDLSLGRSSFEYLTCDLTPEYVRFNAEYTT